MLNRCPVSSYDQVLEVFRKELGGTPDEVSAAINFKCLSKLIQVFFINLNCLILMYEFKQLLLLPTEVLVI